MKKIGFLMMLMFFLLAFPGMSQAASGGTHIFLDGVELEQPSQAQAGNVKGNVMVPLRVIIESLGYDVNWEQKTGVVTIRQGDKNLQLTVGSSKASVDGKDVNLSASPLLQNNSTMVPLRFVGEQTGLKVSWDNETKSAHLYSPDGGAAGTVVPGRGSSSPENGAGEVSQLEEGGTGEEDTYIPGASNGTDTPPVTDIGYINGISFGENRLMISASHGIEANVFTMSAPNRLVVDIPNVTFADTFKDSHQLDSTLRGQFAVTDYPEVSQVRYSLFSSNPSTVRVVVDLNQASQFQVTNAGDGLVIVDLAATSSTPVEQPGSSGKPLVVIDAGHGGSAPGAISISNKKEKDFALAVALKVDQLLQQEAGLDYVLTRTTDATLSLEDRAKMANDLNATVFVSIHGNSVDAKTSPSGTETYYSRDESIPFANVMHKHLVEATGLPDRKVRYKSLHVTRETKMPAVLLEVGYLKHKTDEALMYSEDFQQRVAASIVAGIKEYVGM
ncbi:N-acetylmuramoyl-L-alanine amidase [Fontibacillus phaseoli]|uniref:N-acetylmuramoyl-L-alanine amidase n=1 Tax=Fontibacillus phaseoli TaxID=1416533 RepID=A0A369BP99_9BACL|nr:N-acetylmuramoyl-L-alanine amidase family protein [Fontibacillus phaseoli]RCX23363.1 N-acetylmuramoyl-L-alanine amidase [Fontibacillus phaseoli]